ncbi:protein RIC-3 [Rhinatrema bivittatum]|uniref:protein RIC-3 n=1 Tax=Rhinatrema bivittatum TaxID=194408 RepID=UPI0011275E78|nr:protein RIC-3 [Rhinatrema bivittatum]
MALSAFQKVAVVSGLVLCVSLLLPRSFVSRGKPSGQQEGTPGRFPTAMHQKLAEGRSSGRHYARSHLAEAMSKAKLGSGGGGGGGGGSGVRQNLVGQIIPIYGFGIFLYILYVLFKLSSKGKNNKAERKGSTPTAGNLKRKITDYELSQLQDKLRETEQAMEKILSRFGPNCERTEPVSTDQEQKLLKQLKEITRVMKEGKLSDGVSPEKEAEEAPFMQDWEGYPEETYPIYENSDCCKARRDTVLIDCSEINRPSAEELAERMEVLEDEDNLCNETSAGNLSEVNESLMDVKDRYSTFSDQTKVLLRSQSINKCHCCGHEDDDPAVQAENAGFSSDGCSDQDDHFNDEFYWDSKDENETRKSKATKRHELGTLRKRSTKDPK